MQIFGFDCHQLLALSWSGQCGLFGPVQLSRRGHLIRPIGGHLIPFRLVCVALTATL